MPIEQCVAVEADEELTACGQRRHAQADGFALVLVELDYAYLLVLGSEAAQARSRVVAARVVDGDDLEARVVLIEQRANRLLAARAFVVTRHEERDERRLRQRRRIVVAALVFPFAIR